MVARELVGTGQPSGHDRRLGSEGAEEKKSRNQKALAEFMAAPPRVQNIFIDCAPPSPQSLW